MVQKLALHFGCGNIKKESTQETKWINIDNNVDCNPDQVVDLMKPLPFEDNTIDHILCWNVMEHLPGLYPMYLLREVYRILKPGGTFKFRVPMGGHLTSHISIDHITSYTPKSFEYKPWYKYNFESKIHVTLPKLHFIKFPVLCFYINYIWPLFSGIEGTLTKK